MHLPINHVSSKFESVEDFRKDMIAKKEGMYLIEATMVTYSKFDSAGKFRNK